MEKCGACSKTVYPTEKVTALKKTWHKQCFRCTTCKTSLALGKEEAHDGMPYCKRCHQANFGPGGYGFGSASSLLLLSQLPTAATPPTEPTPAGKLCSGCGNAVQAGTKFCANCGAAV